MIRTVVLVDRSRVVRRRAAEILCQHLRPVGRQVVSVLCNRYACSTSAVISTFLSCKVSRADCPGITEKVGAGS